LARFLSCMRDGWKAYRWSNVDFNPNGGRAKGIKKGSTSTNNHPPISGWHHFWDSGQHNQRQASMRSFARATHHYFFCSFRGLPDTVLKFFRVHFVNLKLFNVFFGLFWIFNWFVINGCVLKHSKKKVFEWVFCYYFFYVCVVYVKTKKKKKK
jgi:hypothetical protein